MAVWQSIDTAPPDEDVLIAPVGMWGTGIGKVSESGAIYLQDATDNASVLYDDYEDDLYWHPLPKFMATDDAAETVN